VSRDDAVQHSTFNKIRIGGLDGGRGVREGFSGREACRAFGKYERSLKYCVPRSDRVWYIGGRAPGGVAVGFIGDLLGIYQAGYE
jgi:hypothetical protein